MRIRINQLQSLLDIFQTNTIRQTICIGFWEERIFTNKIQLTSIRKIQMHVNRNIIRLTCCTMFKSIFNKNNQLYLKNPANASFEILPYEKDKFFLKTEEEQIEFTTGEKQINGLILFSKGNEISATLIK